MSQIDSIEASFYQAVKLGNIDNAKLLLQNDKLNINYLNILIIFYNKIQNYIFL